MGTTISYESEEAMEYKNAIHEMSAIVFKRIFAPWLWFNFTFYLSAYGKMETLALKVLFKYTDNIIKQKSKGFQTFDDKFDDGIDKRKCSLIDILLNGKFKHQSIDDADIRDEVATFVFAVSLFYYRKYDYCNNTACSEKIQQKSRIIPAHPNELQ